MAWKIPVVLYLFFFCCAAEEQCSSYHYEEQTLAKVVRLEYRLEKLEDKVNTKGTEGPNKMRGECPKDWIRLKESCYLFEEKTYQFFEARYHCQRHGADLVHVNDFTENEFLRQHLKILKGLYYWIGLEDTAKEGAFKWVDDNTSLSFTDWYTNQPDNALGNQNCVLFRSAYNYKWNDDFCHRTFGSICEKKLKVIICYALKKL